MGFYARGRGGGGRMVIIRYREDFWRSGKLGKLLGKNGGFGRTRID